MAVFLTRYAAALIPCLVYVMIVAVAEYSFTPERVRDLAHEGGAIETLTAILFAGAGAFGLFTAWRTKQPGWSLFALFMVAAALREVDAHKAWTTMSIFKSRFYVSADVPVFEKICGALVIFALLYGAWRAARKLVPSLQAAITGVPHVLLIYTALAWLAVAKFLDAFFRLLPMLESHRTRIEHLLFFTEESLEMGAALLFVLAPLAWLRRNR